MNAKPTGLFPPTKREIARAIAQVEQATDRAAAAELVRYAGELIRQENKRSDRTLGVAMQKAVAEREDLLGLTRRLKDATRKRVDSLEQAVSQVSSEVV